MAPKFAHRRQELEKLESRTLLAGNVTATVVDGNLLIEGDELGNELTLTQIWGPDLQDVSSFDSVAYKVTPSDDTTINWGDPGEPVFLSGITDAIAIDLGDGNDVLKVHGAQGGPIVANMKIQTGAGTDSVTVGRFGTSRDLSIGNTSGTDMYRLFGSSIGRQLRFAGGPDGADASLLGVNVARQIDRPSTDLFEPALAGVNTRLRMDFAKIGGDSILKYKNVEGFLKWNKVHSAGDLQISADSGLITSIEDCTVESTISIASKDLELQGGIGGKINMDKATVGGDINASFTGPMDLSLNKVRVGGGQNIAYELKNVFVSSYRVNGGSTDGNVTVTSRDGQPHISMADTEVGGDVSLKLRGTNTTDRYRPPVRIVKTEIQGMMTAVVDSQTDVTIDKSGIASRLFVQLGSTVAKPVPANVTLGKFYYKNNFVEGDAQVEVNQPYNVEVHDSEFKSRLSVQLGSSTAKPVPANLPVGKFYHKNNLVEGAATLKVDQPYNVEVHDSEFKSRLSVQLGSSTAKPVPANLPVGKFYHKNNLVEGDAQVKVNQPYNVEVHDSEFKSRLSVQLGSSTAKPVPANLPVGKFYHKNNLVEGAATLKVDQPYNVEVHDSEFKSRLSVQLGSSTAKPVPANLPVGKFYHKNNLVEGAATLKVDQPYNVEVHDSEFKSRLSVQLGSSTAKPVPADLPIGKFYHKNNLVEGNVNIKVHQPYDVVISSSEMHKNAFITYAGHKNFDPSTSSIIVDKSSVLGSFTARNDSEVPMESVSINFTKIGARCAIFAKKVSEGDVPAKYTINETEIGGDLIITSGKSRGRGSNTRGNADGVPGSLIFITETMVGGNLSVRGGAGIDKIELTELKVGGFTRVRTGSGNDYLQLVDSVFAGPVLLDGGEGTDTLVLRGENEFESRKLFRNWEEILEPPDDPNVD